MTAADDSARHRAKDFVMVKLPASRGQGLVWRIGSALLFCAWVIFGSEAFHFCILVHEDLR